MGPTWWFKHSTQQCMICVGCLWWHCQRNEKVLYEPQKDRNAYKTNEMPKITRQCTERKSGAYTIKYWRDIALYLVVNSSINSTIETYAISYIFQSISNGALECQCHNMRSKRTQMQPLCRHTISVAFDSVFTIFAFHLSFELSVGWSAKWVPYHSMEFIRHQFRNLLGLNLVRPGSIIYNT